jgi:hypothetical protein
VREGWVLDNLERLHDNSYLLRERRDGKIRLAMATRTRKTVVGDEDGHGKDVLPSPSVEEAAAALPRGGQGAGAEVLEVAPVGRGAGAAWGGWGGGAAHGGRGQWKRRRQRCLEEAKAPARRFLRWLQRVEVPAPLEEVKAAALIMEVVARVPLEEAEVPTPLVEEAAPALPRGD